MPGFKLVSVKKNYPQRVWQVPPQFFSGGFLREDIISFFRENKIKLSKKGSISYFRGENKLMVADSEANLDKIDKLVNRYVNSVETSEGLMPSVSCAEIIDGKKKYKPYPEPPVSLFFSKIVPDALSPKVRNIYLMSLDYKDGKESKKLAFELMQKFEGNTDIACIVVPANYKSARMIPENCKLPIITATRLRLETNECINKYSKKIVSNFGTVYEVKEEYLDEKTRRGRFLIFMNELMDSGFKNNYYVNEGLYTGYGKRVSSISDRESMLDLLKTLEKNPKKAMQMVDNDDEDIDPDSESSEE